MKPINFDADSYFIMNGIKQDLIFLQDRLTVEQVICKKAWELVWQIKEHLEDLDGELAHARGE